MMASIAQKIEAKAKKISCNAGGGIDCRLLSNGEKEMDIEMQRGREHGNGMEEQEMKDRKRPANVNDMN